MTTDQNPIDLIEARLDGGRKWHKGGLASDGRSDYMNPDLGVCLLGATWAALDGQQATSDRVERSLTTVVNEQFPDRINVEGLAAHVVAQFNDHEDTVFSEIEDVVLPKARQLFEDRLAGL